MGVKLRNFQDKNRDDVQGVSLKDIEVNTIQDPVAKAAIKDIKKFLMGKYK